MKLEQIVTNVCLFSAFKVLEEQVADPALPHTKHIDAYSM